MNSPARKMKGTRSKSEKTALGGKSSVRLRSKTDRLLVSTKARNKPHEGTPKKARRRSRRPDISTGKQKPKEIQKDTATPTTNSATGAGTLKYPFSPYSVIQAEVALRWGRATAEDARTVRENELFGHCEEIASLLEEHWHEIGWDLQRLRNPSTMHTPESIRAAFEPLRGKDREFLFAPLLRPTSKPATGIQVRKSLEALEDACRDLESLRRPIEEQKQKCAEKERAVGQASPQNRKCLGKEIARRKGNLAQQRSECRAKESLIAAMQKKLLTADPRRTKTIEAKLSSCRREYVKLKASFGPEEPEEKIIRDLEKQRDNATKKNLLLAKQAAKECQTKMTKLETQAQKLREEIDRLRDLYRDRGAGFARKDLFNFIAKHRCRHDPRQIAKAIAGLPDTPCRDSLTLCKNVPFGKEPHKNYEVFLVMARAWARRDSTTPNPQLRIQLFEDEIRGVPRTRDFHGDKVPNYVWRIFEDNRHDINQAIRAYLGPQPEPERVPYLIASKLINDVRDRIANEARKTDLERVLSERTRETK